MFQCTVMGSGGGGVQWQVMEGDGGREGGRFRDGRLTGGGGERRNRKSLVCVIDEWFINASQHLRR